MRPIGRLAAALTATGAVLYVCIPGLTAEPRPAAGDSPETAIVGEAVEQALAASPTARVVILLDVDPALATRKDRGPLRAEVARRQGQVLSALHPGDLALRSRPKHAPILAGTVSRAGLERLRRLPDVKRIDLEVPGGGGLAQSVPLVRADLAHALGYRGTGIVVGEVDSGVDTDHPDLVGSVVGQACLCRTGASGCCPNGTNFQTGPGAAEDDAGHGTLVAGVMTSDGHVAPLGVAPDAKIVAVKVTDSTDRTCCMSDVTAAFDWILDNRPDVAAINCSVVSDATYSGDCDNVDATTGGMATMILALRAAGIPVFAAAGNRAVQGGMSAPACVSGAISMGASYDSNIGPINFGLCSDASTAADQPTCYSNSDSKTDLFAPGSTITTSVLGGLSGGAHGTSFAAPHATACAALIKQAHPSVGAGSIEVALEATGVPVVRGGLTFPRIDCLAAIQVLSCPDADADGYWAAGPGCPGPPYSDCDEADAAVSPGAPEICDEQDNDCDGVVDEGYDPDADGLAACVDNCPVDENPGQDDRDSDGVGNACDLDDGIIEVWMGPGSQVRWQQEAGYALYDIYRGSLKALHDTDGDGAAQDYGSCFAENLAGPTFTDSQMPAVGQGYIYLVNGRSVAGVEGDLGRASSGALRPNVHDCTSVFGTPPVVQTLSATISTQQATCDLTMPLINWACQSGVPDAQPSTPQILMAVNYNVVTIQSRVTDADSGPQDSDISLVNADLQAAGGSLATMELRDDGNTTAFIQNQASVLALDCPPDPPFCGCTMKQYALVSSDDFRDDTTYTRVFGIVSPNLPALVQDCIMEGRRQTPIFMATGTSFTVQATAYDLAGHQAASAPSAPLVTAPSSFNCSGDPCGCCLLTATAPVTQCAGLPGMTAPGYPAGICMSF